MNYTARRINSIAEGIGATRYLEIGVNKGVTFADVKVAERTGVDPAFGFNFDSYRNELTHFFQMRSDAFFSLQKSFLQFDIIFIDGLHTFEQVARDFSNAIMHTSSRSVIVLDDTLPDDVFSAIPDQVAAMRHRKVTGSTSKSWHGDVFKIVFYIHDFWPSLNYRTITNNGNPQTLVWRSPGFERPPLFDNFEKISRLSYFDLRDNLQILQAMPEDEAIALCIKQINSLAYPGDGRAANFGRAPANAGRSGIERHGRELQGGQNGLSEPPASGGQLTIKAEPLAALLARASALARDARRHEAENVLTSAMELYPDQIEPFWHYAKLAAPLGRDEEIRRWMFICEQFPDRDYGYLGHAAVERRDRNAAEAEAILSRAVARVGNPRRLLLALADLAERQEEWGKSLRQWQNAELQVGADPAVFAGLGRALVRTGAIEEAENKVRAGLELYPQDFDIRLALAEALLAREQWDRSFEIYRSLLSERPGDPKVINAHGAALRAFNLHAGHL